MSFRAIWKSLHNPKGGCIELLEAVMGGKELPYDTGERMKREQAEYAELRRRQEAARD